MYKHLLHLSTRPAVPRIVAIPQAAQVRPLVRGLRKTARRTIKESAEGIGVGVGFFGTILSDVFDEDKRCRSASQARSAEPSSVPATSSPLSRPPPPADSPPTMKAVALSTLQHQFPPPSRAVGSSGSSPLYVHTSSSSPFSRFSEFSPGSLDSLSSPGILIGSSVLAVARSLNDRLRALPGSRSSSRPSVVEDVERGSDNGSDGSWEDIAEGESNVGVLEVSQS